MTGKGWQPASGARVRILANPKVADDVPPAGVWTVLARSPHGPTWWWLLAVDSDARAWCDTHPEEVESRCVARPNRALSPVNTARI